MVLSRLLHSLRHAPLLESLALGYAQTIDVAHIQVIYKILPLLEQLKFDNATVNYEDAQEYMGRPMPRNTDVARQLSSFEFYLYNVYYYEHDADDWIISQSKNVIDRWYSYIKLKHSHMRRIGQYPTDGGGYVFFGKVAL